MGKLDKLAGGSPSRREFVGMAGASAALSLAAREARSAEKPKAGAGLPLVPFGRYKISRLVTGANPINGGSHLSRFVNNQMRAYFTPERIQEYLAHCEAEGINTWQSGSKNLEEYRKHREAGGTLQYISLASDNPNNPGELDKILEYDPMAVAHHGEVTDRMFKLGQIELVKDFLNKAKDKGVMAGVSTHMPAVVDHIESKGWDPDFYMTCVYERHRTKEELKALMGYVPLPEREVYLEEDPPRMFEMVRMTKKPCLAFKILAAGRLCDKRPLVEQAFQNAFSQIKPTDAVLVGMYPEYEDQVKINADLTRRFCS